MTEQASWSSPGALVKGGKSQTITSLDIGDRTPRPHLALRGHRAPDDETALKMIRAEIERLPYPGPATTASA